MRTKNRGSAVVEAALMMPWLAFLFMGVFDFGFYAYASICTQNAARAVAVLKNGVIGRIRSCEASSDWCQVQAGSYRGYLRR